MAIAAAVVATMVRSSRSAPPTWDTTIRSTGGGACRPRLGRAALEILYGMGEVEIHHRVDTRRYFDLAERLLPADLLAAADPNLTDEAYWGWHVATAPLSARSALPARPQASGGPVSSGSRPRTRRATLARLSAQDVLIPVAVEGVGQAPLFTRATDAALLDAAAATSENGVMPAAAFIGPLDNLIWDLELVRWLFDSTTLGGLQAGGTAKIRACACRCCTVIASSPMSSRSSPGRCACRDLELVVGDGCGAGRDDGLLAGRMPGPRSGANRTRGRSG